MSISVVVPTTLERAAIRETVESVLRSAASRGDEAEVLVVVNGTTARPPLENMGSPMLKVVTVERRSAPGARNIGFRLAHNDVLLFVDDDCIVPSSWCQELGTALGSGDRVAVAAPVRTLVRGSVTAFIDYQRLFHAPADDTGEAQYVVTANCGLRRDLVPGGLFFDDRNFNNAGEDTGFGLSLRDAGHTPRWLGNAEPVSHRLSEAVEEISERYARYGRAHARLHTRKAHPEAALPGALDWYRSIVDGRDDGYRRFSEFPDPAVRAAFTVYDLILHTSFLIGYLEELGREWGHQLVRVDHPALRAGWRRVARQVATPITDLAAPDYSQLGRDPAARRPVAQWLPPLLRQHARPISATPACSKLDALVRKRFRFSVNRHLWRGRLVDTWTRLSRPPDTAEDMASLLRSQGGSFREGCQELEGMLSGRQPIAGASPRPERRSGACEVLARW
ncbi:glycosyltransferase family 2 protein [Allokutzneria oryzae]|uniref:Glycosyltransferase family 2 protein n=1 Tax=Allokutzneria oryzae TaxID=1378989 RepID=A0ABV6A7J9_9PSEU